MSEPIYKIERLDGYTDGKPSWVRQFVPGPWFLRNRETATQEVSRLQQQNPNAKYRVRKDPNFIAGQGDVGMVAVQFRYSKMPLRFEPSAKGRERLPRLRGGVIVGESFDKKCWRVVLDGNKPDDPYAVHKSFIRVLPSP